MSRHAAWAFAFPLFTIAAPVGAAPPETIDILVDTVPKQVGTDADCRAEREAAIISGEIVVCGERPQDLEQRLYTDEENASRYARETMNKGAPRAPDVTGEFVFKGPATISGLCLLAACPPPPALFIDVAGLPEAPEGSDADRIARGLPPLGSGEEPSPIRAVAQEELGLPPPHQADTESSAVPAAGE